jgi:hypothetical protein
MDDEQAVGLISISGGSYNGVEVSMVYIPDDCSITQTKNGTCLVYELPFTLGSDE